MYDIGSGSIRRFDPKLGAFCALLAESQPTAPVEAKQQLKIA
jgi:hypothetical protein